jgi:hypothetical protein
LTGKHEEGKQRRRLPTGQEDTFSYSYLLTSC